MRKSQSALEFMTIVAVGMMLIAIGSFFGSDYILSYFDSINSINAEQMTTNIVSAINLVYSQGIGAQTKVVVTAPPGMVLNRTYLSDNEINLRFYSGGRLKDVFKNAAVNITGSIPIHEGTLTLYIKMEPGRKAVVFVDAPVSHILLSVFNDSARTKSDRNFTAGETVYYSVYIKDFNGSAVDSEIQISAYKPGGVQFGSTVTTVTSGGVYNGSFVLQAGDEGKWLISVIDTDFEILGTTLFDKY